MKARTYVRMRRRVGIGCVLLSVVIGAMAGASLGNYYRNCGSLVTNPDAFAAEQIAAGLRVAGR